MAFIKSSKRFDWHGVQCARCSKKKSVRTRAGESLPVSIFTAGHEYLCPPCWKHHDPAKGFYIAPKSGKMWVQQEVEKVSLRQRMMEGK